VINLPKCSTFDRFKCDHAAMSKKLTSELRYTIKFVGPFARLSMDRRIHGWLSPSLSQRISTFISLTEPKSKPKQGNKLYGPVGPKLGTSTYIKILGRPLPAPMPDIRLTQTLCQLRTVSGRGGAINYYNLFSWTQNPKSCYSICHIECLWPVHGALNVDEKKN